MFGIRGTLLCATIRLLILGGTLFLGHHLAQDALARGHHVTLVNRGPARPADRLPRPRCWMLDDAESEARGVAWQARRPVVTFGGDS